jgi:hypothetical protein
VEVRYDAEAISMEMISLFGLVVYSPIFHAGPAGRKMNDVLSFLWYNTLLSIERSIDYSREEKARPKEEEKEKGNKLEKGIVRQQKKVVPMK